VTAWDYVLLLAVIGTVALGSIQTLTDVSKKVNQSLYRPGVAQRVPGS